MDQVLAYLKLLVEQLGRIDGFLYGIAHPNLVLLALLDNTLGLVLKVWFGFILSTTDFETGRDFIVDDVRVLGGGLDVAMIERLLHQLQVPGFPEELGSEVVPVVVEPEVDDASGGPDPLPGRFEAAVRDRVPVTPCQICLLSGPLGDVGKHHLGVVTSQGP